MDLDFNQETQNLVLKTEYSTQITEITITRPAFGGILYDEIRIFDPAIVLDSDYVDYFYTGFQFIFDIVDNPII